MIDDENMKYQKDRKQKKNDAAGNSPAAVVTGAAKRIGRALALSLAENGYRIVVHYHHSVQEAEEVCREIEKAGSEAVMIRADLRAGIPALSRIIDACYDAFGRADGLVNSAAIFQKGNWEHTDEALWDAHADVNLKAPFFLSRHFGRRFNDDMPADASGWIINIIDVKAERPGKEYTAYFAAKGGLYALTKSLALGMAPRIRVNGIAPGAILASAAGGDAYFRSLADRIPLNKTGNPHDIARAMLYLISADFVTGEIVHVDGGELLI